MRVTDRLRFSWLIVLLLSTACGNVDNAAPPASRSISFDELKEKVSQIRGLAFKQEVSQEIAPTEAFDLLVRKITADEYGEERLPILSRGYKRLGLIPEATDLAKALTDFHRLQEATFYDSRRRTVVVSQEASRSQFANYNASQKNSNPAAARTPLVLGLEHALLEQHFHWQSRIKSAPSEDRKLTFRTIAQADAALLALAYLQSDSSSSNLIQRMKAITRWSSEFESRAAQLPSLLRQKLLLPYREGAQFVLWAYATKGWDGVNALFRDPPVSTSQLLHPEKYYVQRQEPARVIPWGLLRGLTESSLTEHTLGEYLIRILLMQELSNKEATQLASDWIGDHLALYQEGENPVLAWISAWKEERAARAFQRSYEGILKRRHRVRFESLAAGPDALTAEPASGRALLLERRGPAVLFLDGMTRGRFLELSEEIWNNLEIGAESNFVPYDSAQRQLSLRRR